MIVVGRVVLHLKPIAVLEVAVRHQLVARQHGEVTLPLGERRLLIRRAHIGEDQAIAFHGLVCALADRACVFLGFGLFAGGERHMQTGAVHVEHHPVVAALDAPLLDGAVFQGGPAVHAVRVQHAHPAAAVAERHQLFGHDLQEARRVGQFHGHADRMPEAAHVLARGRARPGLGQLGIVANRLVRVIAAIRDQLLHRALAAAAGACGAVPLIHQFAHVSSPDCGLRRAC
ncbi:hypothetical protein FQZ97_849390 [compost metagenome]